MENRFTPLEELIDAASGDPHSIKLEDRHGKVIEDLRAAAIENAPHQWVARRTQSKGRPYESLAYEKGRGRLRLRFANSHS